MISVPESLAFYWVDATNRAAVNVPANPTDIPPDLTLDEAERFEVALLAAERVRVDLWRLLGSLWSATWEAAARAEFPAARLLTYGGHSDPVNGDFTPSVKRAWDEGLRYGVLELPGRGRLVTFIELTKDHQDAVVGFSFVDQKGHWTIGDEVELGPEWANDDNGWRVAGSGHVRVAGGGTEIDPSSLAALCRSALATLKAALA